MAPRKPGGSNPRRAAGDKSSVDTWEQEKPKGKWTEVSADYEVLDALVKEKKITWSKSGRESAKREVDLYKTLEKTATDERKEERDREKLGDKLEAFLKRKEDEATCLMEELRKTWKLHNTKVLRRSKVCAALIENRSIVTTKIRVVRGH